MYPYRRTWRWWISNRFKHLVDGLTRHAEIGGPEHAILNRRIAMMKRWLLVRLVVLVFLSASVISTIVGVVLEAAGVSEPAQDALDLFQTVASSLSSAFLLLFFLANRTLGQLEADMLLVLTVGEHPDADAR